jgi:hypothetical protein
VALLCSHLNQRHPLVVAMILGYLCHRRIKVD